MHKKYNHSLQNQIYLLFSTHENFVFLIQENKLPKGNKYLQTKVKCCAAFSKASARERSPTEQ